MSLRPVIQQLAIRTAVSYIPGIGEAPDEDGSKLKKLAAKIHGGPVVALPAGLDFTWDDAALCAQPNPGATTDDGTYHILPDATYDSKGTFSVFSNPADGTKNWQAGLLKMRGTYGSSAGGKAMPMVQTVLGLGHNELNVPFAVVPIDGLAPHGRKEKGYLLFVRTEKDNAATTRNEVAAMRWALNNVLLPFIQEVRKEDYGWIEGKRERAVTKARAARHPWPLTMCAPSSSWPQELTYLTCSPQESSLMPATSSGSA